MSVWQINKKLLKQIEEKIALREQTSIVYPKASDRLKALDLCPIEKTKVVILGQDPYHNPGEANGLSFSVSRGVKIPPSLRNIYKELQEDVKIETPKHGDLTVWAQRGVLLLNTVLTVDKNKPGSHFDMGWEDFTDDVIKTLSDRGRVCFMLWGKKAQSKEHLIDDLRNGILKAPHPSPFSAYNGFFGCKHFSKANCYLKAMGKSEVDWSVI